MFGCTHFIKNRQDFDTVHIHNNFTTSKFISFTGRKALSGVGVKPKATVNELSRSASGDAKVLLAG